MATPARSIPNTSPTSRPALCRAIAPTTSKSAEFSRWRATTLPVQPVVPAMHTLIDTLISFASSNLRRATPI